MIIIFYIFYSREHVRGIEIRLNAYQVDFLFLNQLYFYIELVEYVLTNINKNYII